MSINFHIQTFGCQMNVNDSNWLARSLKAHGLRQSSFEQADVFILNTCSVRGKPEQKVYSEIGRIASLCKANGRSGVMICVGGCVAQQAGPALARRFPLVRLLFGTDGIADAPKAIARLIQEPSLRINLLDFAERYEERLDTSKEGAGPCAFVNIMQGCNNFCTYCIVPYVRGRQKSRAPEAVIEECKSWIAAGAREITLLGQNVNSYGQDLASGAITFAELLHKIAALSGLSRLRFMTPHPKDIAREVIAAFVEIDILCPRLHLPLQSGSDRILKAMNRKYDSARFLEIVNNLKRARPDILLSTDIIVGFPGETETDFQDTMRLMQEVNFMSSYSFIYSDRPKAKACLLPDKVGREVAFDRLSRLQEWQNQASNKIMLAMKGKRYPVLLESPSRRDVVVDDESGTVALGEGIPWQGKTTHGFTVNVPLPVTTPQDGTSFCGKTGWQGAFIPVDIEGVGKFSLKGIQAGAPW